MVILWIMNLRFWNIVIVCIFSISVTLTGQPLPVVHPNVIERFKDQDSVSCLLILREQVGIIPGLDLSSKEEKTTKVYSDLIAFSRKTQADLLDALISRGIYFSTFYIVNAVQVRIDRIALEFLSRREDLHSIVPDFPMAIPPTGKMRGISVRSDSLLQWGIHQIGADAVWQSGITGRGIVVAGLDTGVEWNHEFLKNRYRGYTTGETVEHKYNWFDAVVQINRLNRDTISNPQNNPCGLQSPVPCDDHGHGTFTMGLVTGGYDNQYTGIAPGSRWIGVRVMERGNGVISTYLKGLEWCLAPTDSEGESARPELAPDIINNSWACPSREGCIPENYWMLDSAFSRLNQAGIFVVAASGNSGRDGCSSIDAPPALFRTVFTVGASDKMDSIADFSSRGPLSPGGPIKPEVVAPGVGIRSIYPGGQFKTANGTSASAPMVAGVAALMMEANPSLRGHPDRIREILINSAVPIEENPCGAAESPNHVYGYGRINAPSAVENALGYEPTAIKEVALDLDFHLFPNPVDQFLHMENRSSYSSIVRIYSLQGQFVQQITLPAKDSTHLPVSDLKSGLYFARIITKDGVIVQKFLCI